MPQEKILVVDDEQDILTLVGYHLARESYDVMNATNGEEGLIVAKSAKPSLIILDLMLPGLSGLDVCRKLKSETSTMSIPIIMLSAKGEEADIVAGLELGADDYVTKPFSPRILMARVKAALRRGDASDASASEMIVKNELSIDTGKHIVSVDGVEIPLTITEFRILKCLARRPGWVFTRTQIVEATQGEDADVTDRSIDVHIVSLRKKLGDAGNNVQTVRGIGYRFKD